MKFLILSICVAIVAADVSHVLAKGGASKDEANAEIIKQELDVGEEGKYRWAIETENGILASESGALKDIGGEVPAEEVQGSASWTSPEGENIQIQYKADENGYQPQGSHLPTSPPIPEAILRSLEYIRNHPPKVEN